MKTAFFFIKRLSVCATLIVLMFFLSANNRAPKNNRKPFFESRWTGTITLEETASGITGTSERHVTVSFNNALPTLNRDDGISDLNFTDDKGTGSQTFHSEAIIEGKKMGVDDCQGSGQSELHEVIIDEHENYYKFSAIGPAVCSGTSVDLINGITTPLEQTNGIDIIIDDEPLGTRRDVLSGTQTRVRYIPDEPNKIATVTTTITWHLVRTHHTEPCIACGSVIRIENQSLGQTIAIDGTPFTLNYRSDRNLGSNSSEGIGGWTLSSQHSFRGNRIYFGNGQEFEIKQELKPVTEELPGVVAAGGYLIASDDGAEMYAFDEAGTHLKTFDALTGALIYEFRYNAKKQLTAVVDAYGQATTIERNANGLPSAIISPYGFRTKLEFDEPGNLKTIIDPSGEKNSFTYSATGLLISRIDPRDFSHTYNFTLCVFIYTLLIYRWIVLALDLLVGILVYTLMVDPRYTTLGITHSPLDRAGFKPPMG